MTTILPRKHEVVGYADVRKAAKNTRDYSSEVQGDTDIRQYRHLPLEMDAPRHTEMRLQLMKLFAAEHIKPLAPQFVEVAHEVLARARSGERLNVLMDLALPYVMGCLAVIYNRPQDRDEWISWGPNVWFADVWMSNGVVTEESKRAQRERNYTIKTQRSAATLDAYVLRVLAESAARGRSFEESHDFWDLVNEITLDGEPLTLQEKLGTGSTLMAGGRDTGTKLITGIIWHLITTPADRVFLRDNPESRLAAIHEIARYLSPLPRLERLAPGAPNDEDDENRVMLSFVSANFDREAFPDPETIDIHRPPKPNLAFGFGRHSCLGLQITEVQTLAFLEVFLEQWPDLEFVEPPQLEYIVERPGTPQEFHLLDEFRSVVVQSPSNPRP
ncbi:cytochrome P450 [uncultured Amnibacterium sp.]|uniref:cytochrome P450 n=1 Tax=uncultured Amnibacterium sp. TaxID=1631851 RepID=UPI0035CA454B